MFIAVADDCGGLARLCTDIADTGEGCGGVTGYGSGPRTEQGNCRLPSVELNKHYPNLCPGHADLILRIGPVRADQVP